MCFLLSNKLFVGKHKGEGWPEDARVASGQWNSWPGIPGKAMQSSVSPPGLLILLCLGFR